MQKSTFNLEKELAKKGYDAVIGIDEAGRGPLAGPVVAAAVVLKYPPEQSEGLRSNMDGDNLSGFFADAQNGNREWGLVRDSKTLSEKQREKVYDFILENFYVGIGLCDHETIDRINILEASFLAMKKAFAALERNMRQATSDKRNSISYKLETRSCVLVDGNKQIPNFSMKQRAVVGGDKIVKSISAASIVAKVTRDRIMLEMHKKYPQYDFDKHKGYGTKTHMEALKSHGPCEIHRRSFAPIKEMLIKKYVLKS